MQTFFAQSQRGDIWFFRGCAANTPLRFDSGIFRELTLRHTTSLLSGALALSCFALTAGRRRLILGQRCGHDQLATDTSTAAQASSASTGAATTTTSGTTTTASTGTTSTASPSGATTATKTTTASTGTTTTASTSAATTGSTTATKTTTASTGTTSTASTGTTKTGTASTGTASTSTAATTSTVLAQSLASSGFYIYQNDSGSVTANELWFYDMSYGNGAGDECQDGDRRDQPVLFSETQLVLKPGPIANMTDRVARPARSARSSTNSTVGADVLP